MQILDGKKVRDSIAEKIISALKKTKARPKLVIIQVGSDERSTIYVRQKKIFGEKLGFEVEHINLDKKISEEELISKINIFNKEKTVNGIIVQMPLPKNINSALVIETISGEKDVDGLSSFNLMALFRGENGFFIPATTRGILSLLDFYKIDVSGKKVVIVGRSLLVGRPTVVSLLNRNATVTVCHTKTKNLKDEVKSADIVIVATGSPKLIKKDFVKKGQIIIDVGITKIGDKLFGDVDFDSVSKVVKAITPVPGGVGPMTVVSLFENLLLAYNIQNR
ncbi:MAG: bifunctional 5,10-methylenetetrahydrofolate dehydrogenase/5,10-methenyltetrahydrofolate cyclohydrolase [Candidatus Paceibacterota bacterium]|jgi:methylenetetrahydrofolate dehydrogenase (NADP+)/methenyltetrahydrofolate cyclohydrolase